MQTAAEQGHSAIVAGLHEQGYELIDTNRNSVCSCIEQ
jgi:hypothetical protein